MRSALRPDEKSSSNRIVFLNLELHPRSFCHACRKLRNISDMQPYAQNPRCNDHAVATVARSIAEFGFRQPIVVDEHGVIVVGHTRYKAALLLKLQQVPVHVATGLTPAQIKAYRIADNKSAELADWDHNLLGAELADLQTMDFDVDILGFSSEELRELLAAESPVNPGDPDWIPEPPDQATTQPGDLWLLGRHRLYCGDAGQAADVNFLLEGSAIHLVNTDPPYNVRVEPRSNNAIAAGLRAAGPTTHHQQLDVVRHPGKARRTTRKLRAKDRPLTNDFVSAAEFDRLLASWFGNLARVLKPGRSFWVWGGYANIANYPPTLKAAGLYFSQTVIWIKEHAVLTRKDMMGNHEWCYYGWREGAAHRWYGPANVTDVWSVQKVNPQHMVHLTEKPVELARRALEYHRAKGNTCWICLLAAVRRSLPRSRPGARPS
jgi:DNA modification methylase